MRVLNRRIIREFKYNIVRYSVIFLLFLFGIMVFVAVSNSSDSISKAVEDLAVKSNQEDGYFSLFVPLSNSQIAELEQNGVSVQETFYIDFTDKGVTTRIYKNRETIDLLQISTGRAASADGEIVVEQHYADLYDLKLNDSFYINNEEFKIVGFGYTIDYDSIFETGNGAYPDFENFALTFVADNQFAELLRKHKCEYYYTYLLGDDENDFTDDDLYRWLNEMEFDETQISDVYMKKIVDDVNKDIQDFKDGADTAYDGVLDIYDGVSDLSDGISDVGDGVLNLKVGIGNVSDGVSNLSSGISALGNGAAGAGSGTNGLSDGISSLNDGILTLGNGMTDVKAGADDLSDGIGELADGADSLKDGVVDLEDGVSDLRDAVYDLVDEYITVDWCNLIMFVKASDNSRINSFIKNAETNKNCAMPMGIVLFFLLAFLIATIAVTDIKKQHRIIGTLYAMGYNSGELTSHFIIVPTLIVLASSICGTILGFVATPYFMVDYIAGGSVSDLKITIPVYLIIYGVISPVVIAFFVNWFIIRQSLVKPVLSMLRNDIPESKKIMADFDKFGIRFRYQVCQLVRESQYYILLMISLVGTVFMMVFGISLYGTLTTWRDSCADTIKYEYKYYYRFPSDEIPDGGEEAFEKEMRTTLNNPKIELKIELIGIKSDTRYFDCDVSKIDKDEIIMSSSAQKKFGWEIGDTVYFSSPNGGEYYKFKVAGITDFAYGLYVFTNIDNMRELFDKDEDYWNMIFSDEKLTVDENRLAATMSREDCIIGAQNRTDSLMGIVYILSCMGIVIFIGMLYIMINIITEKAEVPISILKVVGYKQGEVIQLYLLNSLMVVIVSVALSIPISLLVVSKLFANIIANVPNGMLVQLPLYLLIFIVLLVIVAWFVVFILMIRKVNKVSPLEVLRTRE